MTYPGVLTLGDIARRYQRPLWMIRRIFKRGFLPEPARVGPYRVIPVDELPLIEQALIRAGYLPPARERAPAAR